MPKKGGMCPLPPAHMSLIRKDSWTLTFFIFIQLFAFIISFGKLIKQTLSYHDVLAWSKEHNCISFCFFLLVLIISISTHLFIHFTTQIGKKELYKISRYIVKNIEKIRFFLSNKRREYLASGTHGQNSSTFFPTLRKQIYRIVSFSYYF